MNPLGTTLAAMLARSAPPLNFLVQSYQAEPLKYAADKAHTKTTVAPSLESATALRMAKVKAHWQQAENTGRKAK